MLTELAAWLKNVVHRQAAIFTLLAIVLVHQFCTIGGHSLVLATKICVHDLNALLIHHI